MTLVYLKVKTLYVSMAALVCLELETLYVNIGSTWLIEHAMVNCTEGARCADGTLSKSNHNTMKVLPANTATTLV